VQHRAPETARPDLVEVRAGGPVRITGAYPPPLASPLPRQAGGGIPYADSPRVTRYDRSRHRAPHPARRPTGRAWSAASVVLAAAGVAAVVLGVRDGPPPARVDVPVQVAAAPLAATPPQGAPRATGPAPVLQLPTSEPVRVAIPALGVTSAVMDLGLAGNGAMEVPPGAYPVGWYDRSPTPGTLGPAVLAGHVDWDGDTGAFYGLRELLPGDAVVVDRADGTRATFAVERVEEHAKDEFPTDEVYGDIDHAGLRLITCGGSFDEDSGDYRDNVIVFARLVSTG